MKKVFVTAIIPKIVIEILQKNGFQIEFNKSYLPISKKDLIKRAKDCDALLTLLINKIDNEIIDSLPKLKIISNYAVGYDNIDFNYAASKGIWVTNTPDVLTDATADLAFALLISTARRIVEADKFTRRGKFKIWQSDLMLGKDLVGKNLGIIGAGRIGKTLALRSAGFGMNLYYYDKQRDKSFEKASSAKYLSLNELCRKCDFISIHIPLTEETYHLFDKKRLSLIKDGAILINTARGKIIEEKALVDVLKSRKIFAAGLDVYEFEPKITKQLLKLDNVILLPHIGSATEGTRNKMAEIAAKNIVNVLRGKEPITPVLKINN